MKIKSIEFHDENNTLALRVEGVSYKTFLLAAQDITRFLSNLDSPEAKAEEPPPTVAEAPEKTRKPRAAKPAPEPVEAPVVVAEPDPRQVTVEEVIARKLDQHGDALQVPAEKVIEAIVAPMAAVFAEAKVEKAPEPIVESPVVTSPVSPEDSTLDTFELDARSILGQKELGQVIPMSVQIWKDHKDEILKHGKAFTNKCSGVLARIVAQALKIPEQEAFTHIKEALKANYVQEQAQKVAEEASERMLQAAKEEPVPAPAPAAANSDRAEIFLEKLVKRSTQALKDALIVGCEMVVTEENGKRTVTRSALQRLFAEIKSCHEILADEAAVTRALDSSQMPIFAALPPTRAKWLKDN